MPTLTRYNIIRRQTTPPGEDKIIQQVDSLTYPHDTLMICAQAAAEIRDDVKTISERAKRVCLIGQPAGTGNKYSPSSVMVQFIAKPDLDQLIPVDEATEAICDMIGFGSKNGSHLRGLDWKKVDYSYIEVSLARDYNYETGKPQKFRIKVEAVEVE